MRGTIRTADLTKLLPHAIAAAREAGRAELEVYCTDFSVERKKDNSPLTLADRLSHEIIIKRLSKIRGFSMPILSEEGEEPPYEERKGWEHYWLIDPLDGTKEFVNRNGEFTVNIAIVRGHRPVLGVVYAPVKDTLYAAYEEGGAYKEIQGRKFTLPEQQMKGPLTVVGSRSHGTEELAAFVEELKANYGEIDFTCAGSSLKFCLVADGEADVYPRFGPTREWDTAAGQAIAEQVGVSVVEMKTDKPLLYNKENLLNPWFMVLGPRWKRRDELFFLQRELPEFTPRPRIPVSRIQPVPGTSHSRQPSERRPGRNLHG